MSEPRRASDAALVQIAERLGEIGAELKQNRQRDLEREADTKHFRELLSSEMALLQSRMRNVEESIAPWQALRSWGADVFRQAAIKFSMSAVAMAGLFVFAVGRDLRASIKHTLRLLWENLTK